MLKRICLILVIVGLICCVFLDPAMSLYFSYKGLEIWLQKMVPTLFTFMILSDLCLAFDLLSPLVTLSYPFFHRLLGVSKDGIYAIIIGFLFGFPLGAKTVVELYRQNRITYEEACFLLPIANHISPIFLITYVLPTIHIHFHVIFLLGIYGIPLLYGMLWHSLKSQMPKTILFKSISSYIADTKYSDDNRPSETKTILRKQDKTISFFQCVEQINQSIQKSVSNIIIFMGYMIFFQFLNIVPYLILHEKFIYIAPLLEISGGIFFLKESSPIYAFMCLSFGGLSCCAQTLHCIDQTDLKNDFGRYLMHKAMIALLVYSFFKVYFICFS